MKISRLIIPVISLLILSTGCGILKNKKSGKTAVSGQSSKDTTAITSTKNPIHNAGDHIVDDRLEGEWTIKSVKGENVESSEHIYLFFKQNDTKGQPGKMYGYNGCNTINGEFKLENGKLKFENMLSTMRLCDTEVNSIAPALDETRNYAISQKGNAYVLTLKDEMGIEVMSLTKHNLSIVDGAWVIENIKGKKVKNGDNKVQIIIDVAKGKLRGNTGCNAMTGKIAVNPDKLNAIEFIDIKKTTDFKCDKSSQEKELLSALEAITQARMGKHNKVELLDSNEAVVIVMKEFKQSK